MSTYRMLGALGPTGEPAFLRKAFVLPTLVYPLWHLFAPASATDPWIFWWLVSASFPLVAGLSLVVPMIERNLLTAFHLCSWLVTLQLYLLAYLNHMQTFYAVGSITAVLATLLFIRTIPNLVAYTAFLVVLGATLFALEPDPLKVALWGGVLPVAAGSYHRLSLQLAAARLARSHQGELERRVAERTLELSEANRRLRREMEERARLEEELRFSQKLEAVGRLAGGVAHDFNNVITTIGIYADLLLDELPADSPLRDEVAHIQKARRQASALTQQLLTFSRRREVDTRILELKEIVVGAMPVLERILGEDTKIARRLEPTRQTIRANADQLEQALINLALNARDAMPEGGSFLVETRVVHPAELASSELAEVIDAEELVMLAVSDTGVGMDQETRTRAFDPFFSRKPVDRGTGLGLSLVYGVVKHAGGHVRVLSEPGRGARFELYWPRASEAAEASDPRSPAGPTVRGAERILLVEDETDLRQALEEVLCRSGYAVAGAESAEAAVELLRVRDFDLVVSDVVMPGVSGLELAASLTEARPALRLLLISGHLNHPSLRAPELPPGITLLGKPFAMGELTAKIREVLDAPRAV